MFCSIPRKDPSGASTILQCTEFNRIQQAAHIITPEERAAAAEKVRLEKEQTMVIIRLTITTRECGYWLVMRSVAFVCLAVCRVVHRCCRGLWP